MITSENNYVFNHSQIEEVYFTGLVDEEEEEFKKRLKEAVKELKKTCVLLTCVLQCAWFVPQVRRNLCLVNRLARMFFS